MEKEYFKNYNANYYKNNKEKWKEYNSSEYSKKYHAMYYQNNKEKYAERHNEFTKKYEGKFVYFVMNENTIKYIGKTTNLYKRFSWHKKMKEKFDPDTDYVIYLDFSDKLTEEELEDAEKYFIELYKLDLNICRGVYDTSIVLKINNNLVFKEFKLDGDKDVH